MADVCSVDGCASVATRKSDGWCEKHYYRWYRHGSVEANSRIIGDDEARFWSKVDKTGDCWEWQGSRDEAGYEYFRLRDTTVRSHVYSLAMAESGMRPKGMYACHRCDNPPCIKPGHLYWGTRRQNVDDMLRRDRGSYGERRPNARLTESDVVELRNEYARGIEVPTLEEKYGVKESTIRCIVLGIKWKRAGGPITRRGSRRNKGQIIG